MFNQVQTAICSATAALLLFGLSCICQGAEPAPNLERSFVHPPDSARPWVYWFWLNGNVTREGITADLEAMKRVGIGGVLIMEVDQGVPRGPVDFMSPQWRVLFKHVVAEAQRLGLKVNMNNDAGWNGSGGPWIKPEQSMQKVVWSETHIEGPKKFDGILPQPQAVAGYYRDIAVLAFPTRGKFRIANILGKAAYQRRSIAPAAEMSLQPDMVIDRARIANLSANLDKDEHFTWDVPAGEWTVLRIGHTSTGMMNNPSPQSGRGLECDKLSKEGIEAQFAGMMGKLIADVGGAAGKTLVATHIDSWENGSQNWTPKMRQEFQKRRGYDPLPFLPTLSGRVVESLDVSERFLWDLRQTISELVVENYAGHLAKLAHQHGLRLSIEAYGGPCDDMTYAGRADEPMCEFWVGGGAFQTCKEMASAAHTYGKRILGAESFTANNRERWLQYPATLKALGDRAFCEGVNRFVFHRYAMQPWLNYKPGMTMGPWGLHYERTETWWNMTPPWHEYLARCQFLLRQGLFVADICCLQPEASPQGFHSHKRQGYDYDNCTAQVVMTRIKVKDGRLVLPDGMTYRLLVLPDVRVMTPPLLHRIRDLVEAGAIVVGPPPQKSPSLSGYPDCDKQVKRLADELWGDCDGKTVKEHAYGKGKTVWGLTPEETLAKMGVQPDFSAGPFVRWIHRRVGDMDIYFVASASPQPAEAVCTFRVTGKRPEFWQPETGRIEPVAVYEQADGTTRIPIRFEPSGSVFVIFREHAERFDPVVSVARNDQPILPGPEPKVKVIIQKAVYGVLSDPNRTRDVRAKLQAVVDGGELSFQVARMAQGDDPAYGIVKTLVVEYSIGGESFKVSGKDPEVMTLAASVGSEHVAEVRRGADGRLWVEAWKPGRYELKTASGRTLRCEALALPQPREITGPWELRFPPNGGAPERVTLEKLISWSEYSDPGVKYFSGTGTYLKTINVPPDMLGKNRRLYLDLGKVQVLAQVKLNGRDLGVLWKPPYRVEVTDAVKAGENTLEVRVANLWVNRMIGDESMPEDSSRNANGTLKEWPQWVREGKPSPTGRYTFTTWRLWKRDDPLQESGLMGPVTLRAAEHLKVE
jgi:(4-O-methyl)-D-glucuronate---lignin esterase